MIASHLVHCDEDPPIPRKKPKDANGASVAVDDRCLDCLVATQRGWPGLTFEAVVSRMRASVDFRKEVKDSIEVWQGKRKKNFKPQSYQAEHLVQYQCFADYCFLPDSRYSDVFGPNSKVNDCPGLVFDTVVNELGQPERGLIFHNPRAGLAQESELAWQAPHHAGEVPRGCGSSHSRHARGASTTTSAALSFRSSGLLP